MIHTKKNHNKRELYFSPSCLQFFFFRLSHVLCYRLPLQEEGSVRWLNCDGSERGGSQNEIYFMRKSICVNIFYFHEQSELTKFDGGGWSYYRIDHGDRTHKLIFLSLSPEREREEKIMFSFHRHHSHSAENVLGLLSTRVAHSRRWKKKKLSSNFDQ